MLAVENVLSKLSLEPRDEFGNTCIHSHKYDPSADYAVFVTRVCQINISFFLGKKNSITNKLFSKPTVQQFQ